MNRLLPERTAERVVGKTLKMLGEPLGVEGFDRLDERGVEGATAVVEQAPVGDVVRQ